MPATPSLHRVAVTFTLAAGLIVASCAGDDAAPQDPIPPITDARSTTTVAPAPPATTTIGGPATTESVEGPTSPADDSPAGDAGNDRPDDADLASFDFTEIDQLVDEFVSDRGINGAGLAIVHRDGGIVYEGYWGAFEADRISFVASSSKMVTAGVLVRLHDDGLLDLDRPVAEALDGLADWGEARPDITPAQLVSNSSGLVGLGPNPAYAPYLCQFSVTGTLSECAEEIFATTADADDVVPPDTEFRYGGGQWQVAGGVAEVVSGRSWAELIDEIYVEPCGLDGFGYTNQFAQFAAGGFGYPQGFDGDLSVLTPTDNPNLEGGLYTTVPSYARLLLMHLRDGRCGDNQVLSPQVLDRMHSDRTGEVYGSSSSYGLGWWVDDDAGRLTDPGLYGSVAWLELGRGHGGFLVVEADGATGNVLAAQLFDPVADALAPLRPPT